MRSSCDQSANRPTAVRHLSLTPTCLRDTPERYGLVTRLLHWLAAYLLVWQFATPLGWRIFSDGPAMRAVSLLGPYHGTVGVLVLALVVPRAIWALASRDRRPPREAGLAGRLARLVHGAFYVLMFVVPALALLRAYGSGKGYLLWGIQLVPETGREIAWMIGPADALHAPLAWTLAALIADHVAMAILHQARPGRQVLPRMAGRLPRRPAKAA